MWPISLLNGKVAETVDGILLGSLSQPVALLPGKYLPAGELEIKSASVRRLLFRWTTMSLTDDVDLMDERSLERN